MVDDERWSVAWEHRARLRAIARKRLPTSEDPDDVVSEAFVRLGLHPEISADSVAAWLTTVVINLCADRHRRLATQRALLARAELQPDQVAGPEEEVCSRHEARWLASRLSALPDRQARALHLRAQGLDNGAVARHLEVSVATVEGLVKRSRAVMKEILQAAGGLVAAAFVLSRRPGKRAAFVALSMAAAMLVLPWATPERAPLPGASLPGPQQHSLAVQARTRPLAVLSPGRNPRVVARGPSRDDPLYGRASTFLGPRCLAAFCLPIVDDTADQNLGSTSPRGWSPADMWHYWNEPAHSASAAATRPLVAVVSAYTFDFTVPDLGVFRDAYHLPPCRTEDGCLTLRQGPDSTELGIGQPAPLRLANQAEFAAQARSLGTSNATNPAYERAQLLEGVSAVCPECRLALVSASDNTSSGLVGAFQVARELHPNVVLTAEHMPRDAAGPQFDAVFQPGVYRGMLTMAIGGQTGFATSDVEAPASVSNVIDVGGTVVGAARVVLGGGDGMSFCDPASPAEWQRHFDTGCTGRAGVDLAGPAGAFQGLSVFVSGGLVDDRGWYHPGHLTQALAVVGGLFARHHLDKVVHGPADLYAHPAWFTNITGGTTRTSVNSPPCTAGAPQICAGRPGWDGVTGLGEPRHLPWF